METTNENVTQMSGERTNPSAEELPIPPQPPGDKVPEDLNEAWTAYMVNGFKNNEQMFRRTQEAFMRPYQVTIWMYAVLFAVGIVLFIVAVVIGLRSNISVAEAATAIAFASLGTAAFLAFFIRQPVRKLEENLQFITWLGVVFNTYWTRLMRIQNLHLQNVQEELKAADDDYQKSIQLLIDKHASLRGK